MDKLRFGIVGYGNIGSAHAAKLYESKVEGAVLKSICDIDEHRLQTAKERFRDVHMFNDYNQLLSSGTVDAVIIATPHYLHPVIAIKAFENGINVLTEKPAGVATAQVLDVIKAAKSSGKAFGVMFNQRTNPLFIKMREMIKDEVIGKPKRFVWIITNWYRTQHYYDSGGWRATWSGEGGGVLLNQAPHNLDIWQWAFGMPERIFSACSIGKYHNIEVEDEAMIHAEYKNGATATFLTSTGESCGTNRIEITGTKGKIVVENGTLKYWISDKDEREFCFTSQKDFYVPEYKYNEFICEDKGSAHLGIIQNFTNHILSGETLIAPGEEAVNELMISNAAYLSSYTGEWTKLPVDNQAFIEFLKNKKESSNIKEINNKAKNSREDYSKRWQVIW